MKVILNKAQYDYLKNNNILEQYKKNVKNAPVFRFEEDDFSKFKTFISWSFNWKNTKEGNDFWYKHNLMSYELESNKLEIIEV